MTQHITRKSAEELLHQRHYTVRELADLLGMSRDVVQHDIYAGKLRAVRFGRDVLRVDREAVLEWLDYRNRPNVPR